MHHFKLTYFNARGRAELSRLILAFAVVEYEDDRLSMEEWQKVKPTTPLGQVPILTIDDTIVIPQSMAIARYLAREFDLNCKKNIDEAKCDSITQTTVDVMDLWIAAFFEKDATKKALLQKAFNEEHLPRKLKFFEKSLKDNDGGTGFFVGESLTIADLAVYDLFEIPLRENPELFSDFPKLEAHRKRIEAIPTIKEYLKNRPKTSF